VESYLNNQELAVALAEIRTSRTAPERTANKLIKSFLPAIKQLASTYPGMWHDDIIQEGKIALLRAAQKFPDTKSVNEFFNYAYTAIKNCIINFYNRVVKRQPKTVELILSDDDDDSQENRFAFSDDYNAVGNREQRIDLNMLLSIEALANAGLKAKEVQAFRMYFIEDRTLAEVAAELEISDSQASRLMNSAREKVKQILN
jgi:RNA polymerase sigma factor (sigma-70 family)